MDNYPAPQQQNPYHTPGYYQTAQPYASTNWHHANSQLPQQYPAPFPRKTVEKREANHTLHIILTVMTCGMWAPIWLIAAAMGRKTTTHYR